ncbi:MAG: hypothetical protein AUH85_17775 [Chloroflexi bacterium 13_1_40CM_4_68_4]|nr:MAG: hypothetical protein AUH85_17775 [Chloroflexi bacterium 13_1_40CM_4_68_4]
MTPPQRRARRTKTASPPLASASAQESVSSARRVAYHVVAQSARKMAKPTSVFSPPRIPDSAPRE